MKNFWKKWIAVIISMTMLVGHNGLVFAEESSAASSTQVELEQKGADEDSVDDTVAEETQKQIEMPSEQTETIEAIDEQEENAVENLEQESSGYYLTLDGLTWVYQSDYIDVGTAYSTNDPYVQFKWEMYNVNTGQWFTIADWNYGNWASWKTDCGDYWLHCTARTSDGAIERTSTITFHYVAGNTQISGIYAGDTGNGDQSILLGCASTESTVGLTYTFRIYDVNLEQWSTVSDRGNQWVTWYAKTGTYWAHYELYTIDGRLADTRTIAVSCSPIVRRALLIGNQSATARDPGTRFFKDVDNMYNALAWANFGGMQYSSIDYIRNGTKSQIAQKVKTAFQETSDNDVSYIYITCHGGSDGTIYMDSQNIGYTPKELRNLLDQYVKGTVVIMVTSCYSGNLIQSNDIELGVQDINDNDINDDDINVSMDAFTNAFQDISVNSGELAAPKYKVVCAANKYEQSYGYPMINISTQYWSRAFGWDYSKSAAINMEADANNDGRVTLDELHKYAYPRILTEVKGSHEVVYPENSNFVIYGRY